jgi:hypothetical protein
VVRCTIGSRREVPGERKYVIRDDADDGVDDYDDDSVIFTKEFGLAN